MQKGFEDVTFHGYTSGKIPVPYIGESGNWCIGNDDTGISASGAPGLKGEKGETGKQGPVGPAGEKGADGQNADMSRVEILEEKVAGLGSEIRVNYSVAEVSSGIKWIDNKAIYQRTLVIDCQIGSTKYAINWLDETEMITRLDGVYSTPNWTTAQDSYASASDYIQMYISKIEKTVVVKATAKGTMYLTLWYTRK